jgi:hypothetical protein
MKRNRNGQAPREWGPGRKQQGIDFVCLTGACRGQGFANR